MNASSRPGAVRLAILAVLAALFAATPGWCAGVLYVSSFGSGEVLRYDAQSGDFQDTFIASGSSGGLTEPHGVFDRGVDVLVASAQTDQVLRYDRNTGEYLGEFIGPADIDYPVYMDIGPDGLLYISSQGDDTIRRFDPVTGTPAGVFVAQGSGGLDGPSGFAFDGNELFVAGRYSGDVLAYNATTGAFAGVVLDGANGLTGGTTFGLQVGDNGNLYVASNNALRRFDFNTQTLTAINLGFPIGIENHPDGGVVVATGGNLRHVSTLDNAVSSPLLGPGGVINTLNFFHYSTFAGLPGDFNGDGDVDAVDYAVWREALGTSDSLAGNGYEFGPSAGVVDAMDYQLWRQSYGVSHPSLTLTATPEPNAGYLAWWLVGAVGGLRKGRRIGVAQCHPNSPCN